VFEDEVMPVAGVRRDAPASTAAHWQSRSSENKPAVGLASGAGVGRAASFVIPEFDDEVVPPRPVPAVPRAPAASTTLRIPTFDDELRAATTVTASLHPSRSTSAVTIPTFEDECAPVPRGLKAPGPTGGSRVAGPAANVKATAPVNENAAAPTLLNNANRRPASAAPTGGFSVFVDDDM
jgi:hypothetical protein